MSMIKYVEVQLTVFGHCLLKLFVAFLKELRIINTFSFELVHVPNLLQNSSQLILAKIRVSKWRGPTNWTQGNCAQRL